MAKLRYPLIIDSDKKYRALADLGLRPQRLDKQQIMSSIVDLLDPKFLLLLAEKWSVTGYDGYKLAESDGAKRRLIKGAVELHQLKGTPWSIRAAIRLLGFGEVTILEGLANRFRDGTISRNALYYHGDKDKWAHYRVILNVPVTRLQAQEIRSVLKAFAPARCVLESLDYREVAISHNGYALRNGQFNRGTA